MDLFFVDKGIRQVNQFLICKKSKFRGGEAKILQCLEKSTQPLIAQRMERNPLRKFAMRSRRFMDAYERGLNGRQAAWKHKGHHVLPPEIMEELGKKNII